MLKKVNLKEKLTLIHKYWTPKLVGELNHQHVKLVKFKGEFTWHKHDGEDELFLVIEGAFDMQFREQTIPIHEGEFIIVPHQVEHCPKAENEVHVLLFEPATTINTGDSPGILTVHDIEKI